MPISPRSADRGSFRIGVGVGLPSPMCFASLPVSTYPQDRSVSLSRASTEKAPIVNIAARAQTPWSASTFQTTPAWSVTVAGPAGTDSSGTTARKALDAYITNAGHQRVDSGRSVDAAN